MTSAVTFDLVVALETRVTLGLTHRHAEVRLPVRRSGDRVEPVFATTIWWLKSEIDVSALTAVLSRTGNTVSTSQAEGFCTTYFRVCGYTPDEHGARFAATDIYAQRIVAGAVHPVVGAHCIAWFGMTALAGLQLAPAEQEWIDGNATDRANAEGQITTAASAWVNRHPGRVPAARIAM